MDRRRGRNGPYLFRPSERSWKLGLLADDTEVFYQISVPYAPGHGRGHRYDDPAFGIAWPLPVTTIADKDLQWPVFGALPRPVPEDAVRASEGLLRNQGPGTAELLEERRRERSREAEG